MFGDVFGNIFNLIYCLVSPPYFSHFFNLSLALSVVLICLQLDCSRPISILFSSTILSNSSSMEKVSGRSFRVCNIFSLLIMGINLSLTYKSDSRYLAFFDALQQFFYPFYGPCIFYSKPQQTAFKKHTYSRAMLYQCYT